MANHSRARSGARGAAVLGLGCAFVLCGCAAARPFPAAGARPGTWRVAAGALKNDKARSYLLHVPAGYRPDRSQPLVVVLHGAFSTAKEMEERTGFSALADREGFIVAYPEGGWGIFGLLQHWNAGHCCGKAAEEGEDDVGFVETVVRDAARRVAVDPRRVYLTGFSNGGMLAYRLMAERTNLFAAAAPVAATHGGRAAAGAPLWVTPAPQGRLPVLAMHGLADENVPFAGGRSTRKGGEREYLPAMDAVRFWVGNNGLDPDAVTERLFGGAVERSRWVRAGEPGSDVALYTIAGWGHVWPGGAATAGLPAADPLRQFDATAVIWEFFSRHARER